ncbi:MULTISPECIES: 5-formyltetrahydrofolate cyclo-ligase [unclassified Enterococcus]|uniref:5-formyltetrahydrofolate cyclo-ligase n=1 Tax=unclassified Enterococcus TaxID=2608891 RepID=UPI0015557CC7|nr:MULTISPECIES: 5-formyltetrahydrofolate cyclo-ligase [unclassified Enterococcus]MBS7576253.1 5-formyltetrahydrofolate cyclo-ligase [Enterococcus sp. MMGLQ5-2]MBS7583486.1 5-formyltetrahydrofolate cyclo-ligase [Enterococcus sp. MMGLQ5-1]NPD11348.1 5-formyltetrahydrofolate cyclo-ligase [Enterococcus sp. MMGLQ5-1]NPD36091.1 5-formyltetrahydrofolate cyclo-ligase [Enterococcus sp. MMGLQ5-2]
MKKKLRQQIIRDLKRMDLDDKVSQENSIMDQLMLENSYINAQTIGIYLPFSFEFNTMKVIESALKNNKKIVIPKTFTQREIKFFKYDKKNLQLSTYGILEPTNQGDEVKAIDLLIVPGVVFNPAGFRIGYGGGYYDIYLNQFQGKTISLVFSQQIQAFKPEKHDIAVQQLIIPK